MRSEWLLRSMRHCQTVCHCRWWWSKHLFYRRNLSISMYRPTESTHMKQQKELLEEKGKELYVISWIDYDDDYYFTPRNFSFSLLRSGIEEHMTRLYKGKYVFLQNKQRGFVLQEPYDRPSLFRTPLYTIYEELRLGHIRAGLKQIFRQSKNNFIFWRYRWSSMNPIQWLIVVFKTKRWQHPLSICSLKEILIDQMPQVIEDLAQACYKGTLSNLVNIGNLIPNMQVNRSLASLTREQKRLLDLTEDDICRNKRFAPTIRMISTRREPTGDRYLDIIVYCVLIYKRSAVIDALTVDVDRQMLLNLSANYGYPVPRPVHAVVQLSTRLNSKLHDDNSSKFFVSDFNFYAIP